MQTQDNMSMCYRKKKKPKNLVKNLSAALQAINRFTREWVGVHKKWKTLQA